MLGMKLLARITNGKQCFGQVCTRFVFKAWKHSSAALNDRSKGFFKARSKRTHLVTKQNNELTLASTLLLNDSRKIPRFGLGVYGVEEKQTHKAVLWALEAGYRQIDTASRYKNERSVGNAIRESGLPRSEVYVVTKLYRSDHGYDKTMAAFHNSLTLLGLDYVDMYLIHFPVPGGVVSSWEAMAELKEKGLTRSIGVSNFNIHHLKALKENCDIVPALNQIEIHPYLQMEELVDYCSENGIAIQAYSP